MASINDIKETILCGPIVRRLEPSRLAVWLALKRSAKVELSVWKDILDHKDIDGAPLLAKTERETVQIGKNLHLVVVNLQLKEENLLQWGGLYSYNLRFRFGDNTVKDLKDLELLKKIDKNGYSTLSYAEDQLPSFVLPAAEIENLKILHGSCRNNDNTYEDALSYADDLIQANLSDPEARPQQLFLSGDQIYADSVVGALLRQLTLRGAELLDGAETTPTDWPSIEAPARRWPADQKHFPAFIRHRLIDSEARMTSGDVANHLISFGEFASMYLSVWSNVLWPEMEDDKWKELQNFEDEIKAITGTPDNYGAIFRRNLTDERTGVTIEVKKEDGETEEIEVKKIFEDSIMKNSLDFLLTLDKSILKKVLAGEKEETEKAKEAEEDPELEPLYKNHASEKHLYKLFIQYLKDWLGAQYVSDEEERTDRNEKRALKLKVFHQTLPKVRRALANISTFMIFDDHEVTDDWNLNPSWRDRVHTSRLGKSIVRNALAAYALFQDWGNRPDRYNRKGRLFELDGEAVGDLVKELNTENLSQTLKQAFAAKDVDLNEDKTVVKIRVKEEWLLKNEENGDEFLIRKYKLGDKDVLKVIGNSHALLLSLIPQLFTGDEQKAFETEETLDFLFGLDFPHRLIEKSNGRFQLPDNRSPLIKWHYSYQGAKHQVLVIDNRTRRTYVALAGAPGNMSFNAMSDLIPLNPQPKEDEVLFVVAPLPILGPSALDELVAPIAYKVFDLASYAKGKENLKARMIGTHPDAIEAWVFDPITQEELLKRLAPFQRIIFLSGDVHYGSSQKLHYWRKGVSKPSCFAQLTSSGLRNIMPSYIQVISQHMALGQKLIRKEIRAERLGWLRNDPKPLDKVKEASAFLRHKLGVSPVVIPNHGWPKETNVKRPPDWRWRIHNILDERTEEERPELIRLEAIPEETEAKTVAALREIAKRHIAQAKKVNFARQILFKSNIGVVSFEKIGDKEDEKILQLKHALFATPYEGKADEQQKHERYTLHKIELEAPADEQPPELSND